MLRRESIVEGSRANHPTAMGNCCGELVVAPFPLIDLTLPGKKKRTRVFFDVSADDEPFGRIEMELFDDVVPR